MTLKQRMIAASMSVGANTRGVHGAIGARSSYCVRCGTPAPERQNHTGALEPGGLCVQCELEAREAANERAAVREFKVCEHPDCFSYVARDRRRWCSFHGERQDELRAYVSAELRRKRGLRDQLLARSNGRCFYRDHPERSPDCTGELVAGQIHVDHVLPLRHRPDLAEEITNLVLSCAPCNLLKSDRSWMLI